MYLDLSSAAWRTSSLSGSQADNCIEVAPIAQTGIAVRDSKDRDGGTLLLPPNAWAAFIDATRDDSS